MAMRLAAHVVGTVDYEAVQADMTLEQEVMWMAYDQLEPLGERGVYQTAAHIQAVKSGHPKTWNFVPWMVEEDVTEQLTSEQASELFRSRFGG
jgi:hypothetical protein